MKDRTLQIARAVIASQMNYWILFTLAVTVMGIAGSQEAPQMWRWGLFCLVPLIYLYFRLRERFWLCFAGHLATAAFFCWLPFGNSMDRIFSVCFVIGFFIYSFVLRGSKKNILESPIQPVAAVGLAAGGLFLNNAQGQEGMGIYYLVPVLVFLGLYFIYRYLENFSSFLVANDSSAGKMPQGEIFRCGILLVSAFSVGGVGLMALFSGTSILSDILTVVRNILVWILRFLFRNTPETEIVDEAVDEAVSSSSDLTGLEGGEPFWFWEVLEKIVMVLMVVGLSVLAVYGLYRLAKYLYQHFSDVALPQGMDQELRTDRREKCAIEKSKKSGRTFAFGALGVRERIRRIYKKEVWNGRQSLVEEGNAAEGLKTMTARECGRGLSKPELAAIYEKARYSGEPISAEDVKTARAAARGNL
ncbi:MAG: DUF4129 domain-containing protein [Lachnospiraceae bacterium]|nr:DUF4129 domain-containing protein [Lachnospiraceae bacterium]